MTTPSLAEAGKRLASQIDEQKASGEQFARSVVDRVHRHMKKGSTVLTPEEQSTLAVMNECWGALVQGMETPDDSDSEMRRKTNAITKRSEFIEFDKRITPVLDELMGSSSIDDRVDVRRVTQFAQTHMYKNACIGRALHAWMGTRTPKQIVDDTFKMRSDLIERADERYASALALDMVVRFTTHAEYAQRRDTSQERLKLALELQKRIESPPRLDAETLARAFGIVLLADHHIYFVQHLKAGLALEYAKPPRNTSAKWHGLQTRKSVFDENVNKPLERDLPLMMVLVYYVLVVERASIIKLVHAAGNAK